MKTIIVLTFFGILGGTFCEQVGTWPEGCRNVYDQAASNFNLEQFFTGTWYMTYAKHQNYTHDCVIFETTANPLQIKYDVNAQKVTCDGTQVENGRHVKFTCKGEGAEKTPYSDYKSIMAVIETDYSTYGTFYTCLTTANHIENVFILTRSKTESPSQAAKDSVKKLGDKFEDYKKFPCN